MNTSGTRETVSRRTALAGIGAGAIGLATSAAGDRAVAQEATPGPETGCAEGRWASVNGADLYHEVHGPDDGPPVLLLHGGIGHTGDWSMVWPVLVGAGYRTVAMDCRGRGRSSWGTLPITYEQMALDAVALLDQLGLERVHVVGGSDGAIVGLELGVRHGARLDRAVIYAANFTPDGAYAEPQPSDQIIPFEKFVADYERLSPEPGRFDELLEALGALYAASPNFSDEELGSIAVPVLILDGEHDELVKPDQPPRMAELIPGAQLVIMPGTGHFAVTAAPMRFNQIVQDFLAGEAVGTPTA